MALLRREAAVGNAAGSDATRLVDIARVGPAMLVYHCVNGQERSTEEQIESIVDSVLLPLARTL